MDRLVKTLKEEHRIAVARVVSDFVRADKVIDDKELENLAGLFDGETKREIFLEAQKLTFSQTIRRLRSAGVDESRAIMKVLDNIANADGICDPSEAYLTMATRYMLSDGSYGVDSYKLDRHFVGDRFVIYSEPPITPHMPSSEVARIVAVRANVEENYEVISHLLSSIGFQFLYIPKLVELYDDKGEKAFSEMSMYLFPTIPADEVKAAWDRIMRLTTQKFINDYLKANLDFVIDDKCPEFLMMLGQSEVVKQGIEGRYKIDKYVDILRVKLTDGDARKRIDTMVNDFNRTVSYNSYLTFNPANRHLVYQGVYKLFFNLVVQPMVTSDDWSVDIATRQRSGIVKVNDVDLGLNSGQSALYLTLLYTTLYGDHAGVPTSDDALSSEQRARYDAIYSACYSAIKGNGKVGAVSMFRRIVNTRNDIRRIINNNAALRTVSSIINIGRDNGFYKIILDAGAVRVDGVPFEQTALYRELSEITAVQPDL